jgi:hypothetical protein
VKFHGKGEFEKMAGKRKAQLRFIAAQKNRAGETRGTVV